MSERAQAESSAATESVTPGRIGWLDTLRGAAVISMVVYHALWDAVYLHGTVAPWFTGTVGTVWQQATCWLFILIAGFSFGLDRAPWRRGAMLLLIGGGITGVTSVVQPPGIHYGILTLLGASILISAVCRSVRMPHAPLAGAIIAAGLFVVTRRTAEGTVGIGTLSAVVPSSWYETEWGAFLGFPPAEFASLDYFPLIPWFFLFRVGVHLQRMCRHTECRPSAGGVAWWGRHALAVYLLHQPLLYGLMTLAAYLSA